MAEKRPAETSTEEPVSKKRQENDISNDSDNTKKNEASGKTKASGTTDASSVTHEPQIKKEVTPNYFEMNKHYFCYHCNGSIVRCNQDSQKFKCNACNKIINFNDYQQNKDLICEKLMQNATFAWSQIRESNQLNIEKNKKNQETFNKMKEYLSSIDKLKDEIREYDKVLCDCENGNTLEVKLFLKKKIRHLENQITSIKKEVETFSVS